MNLHNLKILLAIGFFIIAFTSCSAIYSDNTINDLENNSKVNNFRNGEFVNLNPTDGITGSFFKIGYKFMFENNKNRKPNFEIPTQKINIDLFANTNSENLEVIWLGHATTLINIEGALILTDPMFTKWASPIRWFGPKRFFDPPIEIEDLPILDAVIISHDHYDHLDRESVLRLNAITKKFIVPIGVGNILQNWGISSTKIIEQNWWDTFHINEKVEIITTPSQHFSGRGLFDRNKTLWASFVIKGKKHSIYFGADSGYFSGYKEIGEKYGPFEITLLPIGAYSKMWKSIHMNAEEAVQAHLDLKGELLLPIHWGTFNLALHSWDEPAEELITYSEKENVKIIIPKPGEVVSSNTTVKIDRWWYPKSYERNNGIKE